VRCVGEVSDCQTEVLGQAYCPDQETEQGHCAGGPAGRSPINEGFIAQGTPLPGGALPDPAISAKRSHVQMVDTGDSFIAIVLGQRDNRSDDSAAPKRPPLNAPWSSRARFGTVMWMPDSAGSRYEPLGVIASGGMATVWRVRDTLLDRVVALKRPHPAPSDDPALQRFRREARLAAGITHPNVITIFDAGEDEIGPFLVK
jgi:hypothetical protein